MGESIRELWAIIAAGVAAVVWFSRLESRGIANAAEISRIWAQRKEDLQLAKDSRDRTDKRLDEISADIKDILRSLKE